MDTDFDGELNGGRLRLEYTFDNFVTGPENEFAVAAAYAVARTPGSSYNPLVLCAETGLGKTHLLHAIGNTIRRTRPETKVGCYTAEKFLKHLISAIRDARLEDFRGHFRSLDVLLFDDLQFVENRQRTRGEVFFIVKSFIEAKKQIVLATDQLPGELPGWAEQLLLRLEGAMVADMQMPGVQGRVKILKKKAEQENISLPEDMAVYLANTAVINIRELENHLVRIGAYARLTGKEVSIHTVRDCLREFYDRGG